MPKVAVAIPTFRRPRGLERLLAALAKLETSAEVEIVVADNDGETTRRRRSLPDTGAILSLAVDGDRRDGARHRASAQCVGRTLLLAIRMPISSPCSTTTSGRACSGWMLSCVCKRKRRPMPFAARSCANSNPCPAPGPHHCKALHLCARATGPIDMIDGAGNRAYCARCFEGLRGPFRSGIRADRRRGSRLLRRGLRASGPAFCLGRRSRSAPNSCRPRAPISIGRSSAPTASATPTCACS